MRISDMTSPCDDGKRCFYFTRMNDFSKSAKEKGPPADCERAWKRLVGLLPVQLEGELELPRVVGRCGMASKANRTGSWIAKLVDRGEVGAIEPIKTVLNEVQSQTA